jgi:pimeloyl-ACP methyl ester carboxylesterase
MRNTCHHNSLELSLFLTVGIIILLLLFSLGNPNIAAITATTEQTKKISPYMITTREGIDYEGIQEPGYNNNYSFLDIDQLTQLSCPEEIVIFVHGWGADENEAKERFDRVKLSLEKNNYTHPLVGFSWDSDQAWLSAKFVAKDNGPLLAKFIVDTMNKCKQQQLGEVKIRLIAHSLGARVVLSSLDSLNKNQTWNNGNFTIASVHLMAAAVDDEEVSMYPKDILNDLTNWGSPKSDYGRAIQEEVIKFDNLFSIKDNVLEPNLTNPFYPFQIYPSFEADRALGQNGYQKVPKYQDLKELKSLPGNYDEKDVQNEIAAICDADADGNPDLPFSIGQTITMGDNHGGYIGYRDIADKSRITHDGTINIVVDNWNNKTTTITAKQSLNMMGIC